MGTHAPARAAAAPLLMRRAAMRARVTQPAPVDARSRREQMRSQGRSRADEAVRKAPLRSPQIGRQGSTWARFLEGGGEPPELLQAIVPSRSEPVPIRVLPLPPLWKGVDSQRPKLNSRTMEIPALKTVQPPPAPPDEARQDLAARVNPQPELHRSAVELALVDISQQAGA